MSEYKDWLEQHTESCDTCLELRGRLICDHDCIANCRRIGCNCECGEFHCPLSKTDAQIKLTQHLDNVAEQADAQFQGSWDEQRERL